MIQRCETCRLLQSCDGNHKANIQDFTENQAVMMQKYRQSKMFSVLCIKPKIRETRACNNASCSRIDAGLCLDVVSVTLKSPSSVMD